MVLSICRAVSKFEIISSHESTLQSLPMQPPKKGFRNIATPTNESGEVAAMTSRTWCNSKPKVENPKVSGPETAMQIKNAVAEV